MTQDSFVSDSHFLLFQIFRSLVGYFSVVCSIGQNNIRSLIGAFQRQVLFLLLDQLGDWNT